MTGLILQRTDQANQEDYDVLDDGTVIGRIFLSPAAPKHRPWDGQPAHDQSLVIDKPISRACYHQEEPIIQMARTRSGMP
jgi:hypothetical protein